MSRWKSVLFDLDGTLIDTLPDIGRALAAAVAASGLSPWPWQNYRRMIGGGIRRELSEIVPEDRLDQVMDDYTRTYEQGCMNHSLPYPGSAECLSQLSRSGLRLGVITNKRDVNAKRIIQAYFPDIPMEFVWGRDNGRPMKPDPASGYAACEQLQLCHHEILFVGDGPETDIAFARAAGFDCVGVSWGYRDREEVESAAPDHIADCFEELTRWILSS